MAAATADSSFVVSITSDPTDTVCAGDSVKLTANVAGCSNCTYTWSVAPVITGPSLIVRNTGTYTVTATTGADTASEVQTVAITPRPVQPTIQEVGSQLLSSATAGNQWYFNWTILTDSTGRQISPTAMALYTVEAVQNGCPSPMSIEFPYTPTAAKILLVENPENW